MVEMLKTREEVENWLDYHDIAYLDITEDLRVEVDTVNLFGFAIEELPVQFSEANNFTHSQQAKSLRGSPTICNEEFRCNNPEVTSLEGCPSIVGCLEMRFTGITSLHHLPFRVSTMQFVGCMDLTTLNGIEGAEKASMADAMLVLSRSGITTLKGIPSLYELNITKCEKLKPSETRYLLLVELAILYTENIAMKNILMGGRVNGVMPKHLIPGKINELRALDAKWQ